MSLTIQELWALIGEKDVVIYELKKDLISLKNDYDKVAAELERWQKECDELKLKYKDCNG